MMGGNTNMDYNLVMILITLFLYSQVEPQAIGLVDALIIETPKGLVKEVQVAGKTYESGWKPCGWLEFSPGPFIFVILPGVKLKEGQDITIVYPDGGMSITRPLAVGQKFLALADAGTGTICIITKAKVYEIVATQGEDEVWYADLSEFWKYDEPESGVELLEAGDCGIWGYYEEGLSLSRGTLSVEITDASGKKTAISVEVQ